MSGSLCLLKLKGRMRRNQGACCRGRNEPTSQTMLHNEALAPFLMWSSGGFIPGANTGLTFCFPQQRWGCSIPSQWGWEASREGSMWGILIEAGQIQESRDSFAWLINEQRVGEIPILMLAFHPKHPESVMIFRRENPSCPGISLYFRGIYNIWQYFSFPVEGSVG